MHEHGVRPAFAKQTMETQLDDARVSTASRAVRKPRARRIGILVEHCCEADGLLSQGRARAGGKARRCGLSDYDLLVCPWTL